MDNTLGDGVFSQLPSGHWAKVVDGTYGWKVSVKCYPMGEAPESLKDEPAREATAGETLYLTAYQTGEVEADVCDYNSGEWMGGSMIVPLANAVWSEKLQRFSVYVTYPWG